MIFGRGGLGGSGGLALAGIGQAGFGGRAARRGIFASRGRGAALAMLGLSRDAFDIVGIVLSRPRVRFEWIRDAFR